MFGLNNSIYRLVPTLIFGGTTHFVIGTEQTRGQVF